MEYHKITTDQARALILLQGERKKKLEEIIAIDRAMAAVAEAFIGVSGVEFNLEQREGEFFICTKGESKDESVQ